ncbi:MAG: TatD family hydrolase [Kiritimatiellae bacterium]|nr:TatD family hydrolase [Kiritimatiellia bacterium]
MFFDTHAHLDAFAADGSLEAVVSAALAARVSRLAAIGGSPAADDFAFAFASAHPGFAVATAGLDRDQIGSADLPALRERASRDAVRAIGEFGLDYHYGPDTRREQRALAEGQLELALALAKPVVFHSRDATEDTLAALGEFSRQWHANGFPGPCGVLHCFTLDRATAETLMSLDFFVSFSGILSFLNADPLREVARALPLSSLLVETDSPYLAPRPHRGRRNEPKFAARVAEVLAETRGEPLEAVASATFANACTLYRIQPNQGTET